MNRAKKLRSLIESINKIGEYPLVFNLISDVAKHCDLSVPDKLITVKAEYVNDLSKSEELMKIFDGKPLEYLNFKHGINLDDETIELMGKDFANDHLIVGSPVVGKIITNIEGGDSLITILNAFVEGDLFDVDRDTEVF